MKMKSLGVGAWWIKGGDFSRSPRSTYVQTCQCFDSLGMEDISEGLEGQPIPCEMNNTATQDLPLPASFRYARRNIPGPGCSRELFEEQLSGCDCTNACHHDTCRCLKLYGPNYHPHTRRLTPDAVTSSSLKPVFECNSQCVCGATCSNRLVQHGPRVKLKIAPAGDRGFGLFACENIQQLSFVCEYAGEVVDSAEAVKRMERNDGGMNYLIVLREHCGTGVVLTCVDPKYVGNVGRFANHSCDPNLLMVPVRVDNSVPKLALFARRNIQAGEELTFDYSGESVLNDDESMSDSNPVTKHENDGMITGQCENAKACEKTDKRVPFTENDSEKSFRDEHSGSETGAGDVCCVSTRNTLESKDSETPSECSHCVNPVADKCEQDNGTTCQNNADCLTNTRKRTQTHSEEGMNTIKRSCGKKMKTTRSVDPKTLTNQTVLKVCLCGSNQCKGYLPFDRLILESS